MELFVQIADLFWFFVNSLAVDVGGLHFSLIGAVIFGGIIGLGFRILSYIFDWR